MPNIVLRILILIKQLAVLPNVLNENNGGNNSHHYFFTFLPVFENASYKVIIVKE